MPSQAYRVLVDQPTGTIFALSDNGKVGTGLSPSFGGDSGLLTVLQGATRTPPAWFPTTPPAAGATYLLGTVVPLTDGRGQLYFTCGGSLYQLAPDGRPQPAAVPTLPVPAGLLLPVSAPPVAVDDLAHRLFTVADYYLQGFDTRTGTTVVTTFLPPLVGAGANVSIGPLAVDAQGGRVYIATTQYVLPMYGGGRTNLYVLTVQGSLVRKLPGLGFGVDTAQLVLAGTTRRLVVFGCNAVSGGGTPAEHVQILDLTTGRYLTPKPLTLGACGVTSLLTPTTPGILAVDAAAGTAIVVSGPWPPTNSPASPNPGFAWFINLRTGGWFNTGTRYGCVQVGRQPSAMAIDSRLHRAYVASSADGLVTILDTRTGHVLGVVHVGGVPTSIAVDTHDQQVVVALDGVPGPTQPGGLAFFPADITTAQVPPTRGCAAEGAPYFLALPGIRTTAKG
jgi:YVTN family beta-propeller protein